jgi:TonB family protein
MVVLRVHVDATGDVTKVDVDASKTTTSSAELQAAAVTAAEAWKFNPGRKDGRPVGGLITIPVTFSLEPIGTCPDGQVHAAKPPFQCLPSQPAATS